VLTAIPTRAAHAGRWRRFFSPKLRDLLGGVRQESSLPPPD
jgi:hypothetical protein